MKKHFRSIVFITALLFLLGSIAGCGSSSSSNQKQDSSSGTEKAASFPEKDFEFLVPMGAGGGSDVFCRTLVKTVADNKLNPTNITVVNKPGGSGSIGWSYVANDHKGNPYELSTVSSSFYTGPISGQSPVSYKDFTHIIAVAEDPTLLVVPTDSPYQTMEQLLEAAKAKPESISSGGSSGLSMDAVVFYALSDSAGVQMKYVPFAGGGEVMTSVLGGHVTFGFLGPSEAASQLEAGKMKALAVTTEDRAGGILKDVPTLKELGHDVVLSQLRGVVAPSGISQENVDYLHDMFKKATETPEWKEFVKNNFMEEKIMGPDEFLKASQAQNDMYAKYLDKIEK
ncbi:hypothetical protein Desdi_0794 [Desulfitobacterium dichloroeliminans LMG P-21439]|uniref:Tripartite tricarboxylate transporter family receptor n=1 Tax=Desulfitobacterium dichloroeliminans (strain LMG P-21439 / DCA1) TaxID=871963 RepID=L0F391_DESDL|nr:tripartite tricarboxylate transporter substrate binding protein [Desulfitobacterium dichloroeliminans]AGA68319.1 hypothetical protein Desdi_0794 [Desulfitobacterium dichloroeliminans LMG P-21439]